jgi:hypothetical protein
MLCALSDEGAEYLIVGAFAMATYGLPRSTDDIDIWVRRSNDNALRVWRALVRFRALVSQLSIADFQTPDLVYQIGVAPRRIDILTSIGGIEFEDAWKDRRTIELDGRIVPVIGRTALIRNKKATGRPKDLADVAWLESHSTP